MVCFRGSSRDWPHCALALLLIGTLVWTGWRSAPVAAQTTPLHAAFSDVDQTTSDSAPPVSGELRIASGPTLPVKQPAKAKQSPAKKAAAPRVRQSAPSNFGPPVSTEGLPLPQIEATVPIAGAESADGLKLTKNDKGLITLVVRDKSLSQVLALIAQTQNLNIVASNDIDALISITLRDVPIDEALTAILSVANYTWVKRNNIIMITSLTDANNLPPDVQGRQVQVFDLDFVSAPMVAETVGKLLSPVGKVTIGASSPANNKLTQERVVVEDLPESLARIAAYIAQVDQPPRQVLIEAHVLDVKLNETNQCGVDFAALGLNSNVTTAVPRLATNGFLSSPTPNSFANATASPAFVATLGTSNLGAVIEVLQQTTDAKTLGSPKLLVLNEQEARIQVGETLYFTQVTTTQTSSQQGAGSVEAGTILRITPRITRR